MSKIRVNGKAITPGAGPLIPPKKPRHYKGRRALYPEPRRHPHSAPSANARALASMKRRAGAERSLERRLQAHEQVQAMLSFFGPSQLTAGGQIRGVTPTS